MSALNLIPLLSGEEAPANEDIKVLISPTLSHPLMAYLAEHAKGYSVNNTAFVNMPGLFDHLKWKKEELELGHHSKYNDVATVYSYAECCGYTIIGKSRFDRQLPAPFRRRQIIGIRPENQQCFAILAYL